MEIVLYFGIAVFAIIMLIVSTMQNRKNAKHEAENMGDRLNSLKNENNTIENEKVKIEYCPICSEQLYAEGKVFICKNCGSTYNEKEL